ncbi:hypothetical protein DFH06DRAFT_1250245 [Mycena polygramma]|nr:hypothetical protein DFH06DRAFT_1250245 [Mycena polygramma]
MGRPRCVFAIFSFLFASCPRSCPRSRPNSLHSFLRAPPYALSLVFLLLLTCDRCLRNILPPRSFPSPLPLWHGFLPSVVLTSSCPKTRTLSSLRTLLPHFLPIVSFLSATPYSHPSRTYPAVPSFLFFSFVDVFAFVFSTLIFLSLQAEKDYQPASYQKRWTCMNLTAGSCSPADARDSGRATVRQAAAAACNRRVPPHPRRSLMRPTLASPTTNPDASACTTSTKYPKSAATSSTSLRFLAYGNSQCFPLLPHCVCLMSTLGYLATGLVGLVHPAVDKARRRDYSSSSPFLPLFLPGRKVPRSVGASSLPTVSSSVQPLESQVGFFIYLTLF